MNEKPDCYGEEYGEWHDCVDCEFAKNCKKNQREK